MSGASQAFCLLWNSRIPSDLPTEPACEGFEFLELRGSKRLVCRAGKLLDAADGASVVQLNPIRNKRENALLMSTQSQARVTVNGARAACIAALKSGDVLDLDGQVLHVSLLYRPYVGPPEIGHLASKCGYCRVPIRDESDMRIYVCPNCNLPTHAHAEEVPVEKRLQCVELSSHCGHCQARIVESPGFSHVPTL
jgi:hypothetical protein